MISWLCSCSQQLGSFDCGFSISLQDCGRNLTLTLINHHQDQIASFEQLAEETILSGTQMILPEYITEFPDIPVKIENSLQDLLCEVTVSAKRLRKTSTQQHK